MSDKENNKVNDKRGSEKYMGVSMLPPEAILGTPAGDGSDNEDIVVRIPLKCPHCSSNLTLVECEKEALFKAFIEEGDSVQMLLVCEKGHIVTARFIEEAGAALCFATDRKGIIELWPEPDDDSDSADANAA
jgi:hypothetical protein